MGGSITENPHPDPRLSRFTITVGSHTIFTTVTAHPGAVRDWLHETLNLHRHHRHCLIVGLGVQWTPSYSIHHQNDPAATLQLCVGKRCLIFQLHHADSSPLVLRRVLADPTITFVGLHNHSDRRRLAACDHRLEMDKDMPIDLRGHVYGRDGRSLATASIEEIAAVTVGLDVGWSEEISRSDWEDEDLDVAQIQQATIDAFLGFSIGMKIDACRLNPNLDQDMMDDDDDDDDDDDSNTTTSDDYYYSD